MRYFLAFAALVLCCSPQFAMARGTALSPYLTSVYSSPELNGRVGYRLAVYNTEQNQCLQLDAIDWARQNPAPAVKTTNLCRFSAGNETFDLTKTQSVDFHDLRWVKTVPHFTIEYVAIGTATSTLFFDCRIETGVTPAILCAPDAKDLDEWEKTEHRSL